MLRVLVMALLVANGLFWAWSSGSLAPWLSPPMSGEREPERLARQIRPERLTVLSPRAAAQAASAAATADAAAAASAPR